MWTSTTNRQTTIGGASEYCGRCLTVVQAKYVSRLLSWAVALTSKSLLMIARVIEQLHSILPLGLTIATILIALWGVRKIYPDRASTRLGRQMGLVLVVILGLVAIILALPITSDTTGQLLSLFGIVLTAVIALSSTTFVSNAMAGIMLRAVNSFRAGDFIKLDDYFGRVTEKGLLHTEIQTEDRDLLTLPNLYVITHPVRVVRSSGTLVSCEVSLGYDIYRRRISALLKEAAEDAKLADPFVRITDLGDYAVSYRVSGFLENVDSLVSSRTELRSKVLDRLHGAGIEIVSPNVMLQRPLSADSPLVPPLRGSETEDDTSRAEDLMFDKATLASRMEKFSHQRDQLEHEINKYEKQLAKSEDPVKPELELEIAWRKRQITSLNALLEKPDTD